MASTESRVIAAAISPSANPFRFGRVFFRLAESKEARASISVRSTTEISLPSIERHYRAQHFPSMQTTHARHALAMHYRDYCKRHRWQESLHAHHRVQRSLGFQLLWARTRRRAKPRTAPEPCARSDPLRAENSQVFRQFAQVPDLGTTPRMPAFRLAERAAFVPQVSPSMPLGSLPRAREHSRRSRQHLWRSLVRR